MSLAVLLLAAFASTLAAEPAVLKSPTGKVEVSFSLAEGGAPLYAVTYAGKPVVAGSRLGLTLRQTGPLASGFRVLDVKRASRDETYTLVAGKTREARDRSEEMTVSLERAGERPVRHGSEWFVGAMTDGARKIAIPLGFLGGKAFDATIFADTGDTAANPARLAVLPARLGGKGRDRSS
jgi:hypothetical protein